MEQSEGWDCFMVSGTCMVGYSKYQASSACWEVRLRSGCPEPEALLEQHRKGPSLGSVVLGSSLLPRCQYQVKLLLAMLDNHIFKCWLKSQMFPTHVGDQDEVTGPDLASAAI